MADVLLSADKLFDRLGHEELQLKHLGLVNHAAGMRAAIVILIKEVEAARGAAAAAQSDLLPARGQIEAQRKGA